MMLSHGVVLFDRYQPPDNLCEQHISKMRILRLFKILEFSPILTTGEKIVKIHDFPICQFFQFLRVVWQQYAGKVDKSVTFVLLTTSICCVSNIQFVSFECNLSLYLPDAFVHLKVAANCLCIVSVSMKHVKLLLLLL